MTTRHVTEAQMAPQAMRAARRPGPAIPSNYHPPRWLPGGRLQTCSGIVIGCAIAPRMPPMTKDGERIQAALLDPRTARPRAWWERALGAVWRWM